MYEVYQAQINHIRNNISGSCSGLVPIQHQATTSTNTPSLSNNPLAPGKCCCNLNFVIHKLITRVDILTISSEFTLRQMPQAFTDDQSTLVQVVAWCQQATSHCLSECKPRSMLTYGVTRPQWVKPSRIQFHKILSNNYRLSSQYKAFLRPS